MKRTIAGLALAVAACGDGGAKEPVQEKPPVHTEPGWDGLRVDGGPVGGSGFGETLRMAAGAYGAEAVPGVVHAGRELLAVGVDGDPVWRSTWSDEPVASAASPRAVDLVALGGEDGAASDLLLVDSWGDAHRIDGVDGSVRWSRSLGLDSLTAGTAVFGTADAPLFFPAFGTQARFASDGAVAWRSPLPSRGTYLAAARREGETVLVAAIEPPGTLQPDVFVVSAAGEILGRAASDGIITGLSTATLDAGDRQVALVGTDRGRLVAIDQDGGRLWSASFSLGDDALVEWTYVGNPAARDLDGDGIDEIAFLLGELGHPERTHLVVADAAGREKWRVLVGTDVPAFDVNVGDDGPVVAAMLGTWGVVAIDPAIADGADPVLWSETTSFSFSGVTFASDGSLFVGALDGTIRSFDPRTGAALHERYEGFFQTPAAAVVDGTLFVGDEAGRLVARRLDGTLAWTRPIDPAFYVLPVEIAPFVRDGETLLAVLALHTGDQPGLLQVVRTDGEVVSSLPLPFEPAALEIHGDEAIVQGKRSAGIAGVVASVSLADDTVRWTADLPKCQYGAMHATAAGIGVACHSRAAPPFVAMLANDGTVAWTKMTDEEPQWVRLDGDRVTVGGAGPDGEGIVVQRDRATGEIRWTQALPWIPDPADGRKRIAGTSWFGELAGDNDGDGAAELVVSTNTSQVALLDGATGKARWRLPISSETDAMHYGGPLALVPATDAAPAYLFVAQGSWDASPCTALAVSLGGEVLGTFAADGSARTVAVGADAEGEQRTVLVHTLGTAVFGVEAM